MEPGVDGTFAASNSSGMHSLQCTSLQQGDMHQKQKDEIQQQGDQQLRHKVTQGLQQQHELEDHSNQQEQFERSRMQHPEQSQTQPHDQGESWHLKPPQPHQEQHWQPEQQQQLQQVQMQQMLQLPQQKHLQEMHSQQQQQQELPMQLQQQQQEFPMQLQQQQQELPSQLQLQQQELPLQSQQQELPLLLQQQQLPPQLQQEHLKQLPQPQQQQLEQSPFQPQQQHLQQLPQSQQHLQQSPLQPQQQYLPQSQQQPQQSSVQPQQQHLQKLSQQQPQYQLQQSTLQPHQQHLLQPQQHPQQQLQQSSMQSQQQQLQHFSQPQQQPQQQLPLQPQEQRLLQSQQKPQQQLQQSPLPSQHQHLQQLPQPQQQSQQQLQQSPLPGQQQHLQRLPQPQQPPQPKLQQAPLQQQQQSQQQLQQSPMLQPHQQHLQQLPQPQKQHLQQLPQPQQAHSQQLPQSQQQSQQKQIQPHLQQLSQSQQQQLQPQQQLNHQQPPQPALGQATTSSRGQNASGSHSISFGSLIPMILPHLSREQSERLQGLYSRLRKNEVTKEDFLRATRNVVGDQMLVQAVRQMQQKQQAQSQSAPNSQANQLQQQQQQQRHQQHTQGSSQQFVPQQNIHTQQLNEPQPFQQASPVNIQQQTQRTSDYQPHSQTAAPASLAVSHSFSDNKPQQLNQTSTINLHQVKHEVDRTMIGLSPSNQQQQQHLQVPQSSFPMYGRTPGNYSSHSFSASPGISPSGVKAPAQDSQTRQVIHPQVGAQVQGGPTQLSNIKTMPKYDLSKLSKRREDDERQKMLQSGGASHFSGQHQPSVWATSLDKEKAGNTGILPSSSVHIKQEVNDNSDQQQNIQTLQPMTDNLSTIKSVVLDPSQSSVLPKTESVEHQSIKTSSISSANISTLNQPLGSTGLYSDHLIQAPLATSAATLQHTLSGFGGPISGGHSSGNPLPGPMRIQVPSTAPSSAVGSQIKTPPKKMLIGQKKPYEVTGSTQLASKKQKVSGGYLDQSIDQLNDVTAVSGVNLREEEEQLFAGPKEESRATEAMRRVVQEEEERFFLQKGPLRAKLAGIMAKYGIKYISSDSERCLSLCVEERLRTTIGHLIRLSKQRVDLERLSHKVAITSDVRRQILAMNKKAKDDLEKKQAEEAEKLRKLNEAENIVGPEGEKDETRTKAQKAQKEEDDKMRANAANVAARAAVGGDDMLSKWQMMAEQARQKREGTSDGASNTRNRDVNRKSVVGGLKSANVSDHQDAPSTGIARNSGRTLGPLSQTKPARTICVKDVIALLEREPQMTKSTLLYRLYERDTEGNKEKGSENQNNENTLQ